MEPATGIEPAASRLRGGRATFSASLANRWSSVKDSNLRLSLIGQVACHWTNRGMVHGRGFEPRYAGCKPAVLPLDEPWIW